MAARVSNHCERPAGDRGGGDGRRRSLFGALIKIALPLSLRGILTVVVFTSPLP